MKSDRFQNNRSKTKFNRRLGMAENI